MLAYFRNFNIAVKIPVFILSIILIPIILWWVAADSSERMHHSANELYNNHLSSILNISDARHQIYQEFVLVKSHIITLDEAEMARLDNQIYLTEKKLNLALDNFEVTIDKEKETQLLKKLESKLVETRAARSEIIEHSHKNIDDKAEFMTESVYRPLFEELEEIMEDLTDANIGAAHQYYQIINEEYLSTKQFIIITTGITITIAVLIGWLLMTNILLPITEVEKGVLEIQKSQDLSKLLEIKGQDEITRLGITFNSMLHSLREAQVQMLQNEKLASLGALVAGIAHEVNTPIGIAVTMNSTVESNITQFTNKLKAGLVKKSEIDVFLKDSKEELRVLANSLDRASFLIHSFKQVAVDQISEERRVFDIAEVVNDVLATLQHQIKNTQIKCLNQIENGIEVNSYPGPFGQVITNLFNNSIIHAFAGRKSGTIIFTSKNREDLIEIGIEDDGVGIPENNLKKIFDPFFTTRLGQGGSGLGLNIVYNIVEGILGGSVTVESNLGSGSKFKLLIPKTAPIKE